MNIQPIPIDPNESVELQHPEGSTAGYIPSSYRMPEWIVEEIVKYYQERLDIQESEIRALSNELSQIKENNQQHNYESEQIANQYKEEITKIPEVQQIGYTQYEKSIEFIVVVNSIERDLFYHLSQIESQLCDQYTDWIFEFETIGSRTFSQQPRDGYVNLFSRD